jgi:XTP/dITP diphosphohydrolase
MRLIVATANLDKVREIRQIIKDLPIKVISLKDIPEKMEIREGKKSFSLNAGKKALTISKKYPADVVIGEDSGLEVDILHGQPGVCSARFAGKNATSAQNIKKLLSLLSGVPQKSKRSARFITFIAIAHNKKLLRYCTGSIRGRITNETRGTRGFGYDPVFYVPRHQKTFGQLPAAIKNRISHRARALRSLKHFLRKFMQHDE